MTPTRDPRSSDPVKEQVLLDPKIRKVHDYWVAKHRGAQLPSRSDIDPIDLSDCLGHIMMLDVLGAGQDFMVRLAGLQVEQAFGRALRGRQLSELFGRDSEREWFQRFRIAAVTGDPEFRRGSLADLDRPYMRYDCAILPLSGKDDAVTQLLCCYRFGQSEPSASGRS